jgi:hypothetical protein
MFIRAHLIQILFFFVILFIMLIKMYSIADLLGRVLGLTRAAMSELMEIPITY